MVDPLEGLLAPGPPAPGALVASALAASLAPHRAPDDPPTWLDASQVDTFRLVLHIVRTHGGALCADPVGTGKTFIALAVSRALGECRPACLVPAPLVAQWQGTAARLGIEANVWSHALLSRGRLPPLDSSFVIVDESHHFRHPDIRRYRVLAPWLVGRRVLLLSATPVVNRPTDLYHQLHLCLRDDILGSDGAPSLRAAFDREQVPGALGRCVIQCQGTSVGPESRQRSEVVESGAAVLVPDIDGLGLSTRPDIAALLRSVLLRAASSSPAALLLAVRRYRRLLLHARDAEAAGRPIDRRSLRLLVGEADEQLLLWALLPESSKPGELVMADLPALDRLVGLARQGADATDAKSRRLQELLADRMPTLVFVTSCETLAYLRRYLPDRWIAWCSGQEAGIGTTKLARHEVLQWFRPGIDRTAIEAPGRPRTLLTTDVAAEGLDLQSAGRVVHYDLPWTDVKRAQRNGRAVRRGSAWRSVEIVQFVPGEALESRLRQQEILARKAVLPSAHGLGSGGRHRWRWRRELADGIAGTVRSGLASVASDRGGLLAGIALEHEGSRVVSTIYCQTLDSGWREDPDEIERRLREATHAPAGRPPTNAEVRQLLASLSPNVRALLRSASALRVSGTPPTPAAARLGHRLRGLAASAARRRDAKLLELLDRALHFGNGGHTAGEAMLIADLAMVDDAGLLAALPDLPAPTPVPPPLRPILTGLIIFGASGHSETSGDRPLHPSPLPAIFAP